MFPHIKYVGNSIEEILLDNIEKIYLNINSIAKRYAHVGDQGYLFWQYPAITERDAYERHLQEKKIASREANVQSYIFHFLGYIY